MVRKSTENKKEEKREEKSMNIEATVGRDIVEKMEYILNILESLRKRVKLSAIGKEKIDEAMSLVQEIIDIMPMELVTSIISEMLEGRESELKIKFSELKLDGAVSITLAPFKKSD